MTRWVVLMAMMLSVNSAENHYDVVKPLSLLPDDMGTIQRVHWHVSDRVHGDMQIAILHQHKYMLRLLDQPTTFPVGALLVSQVRESIPGAVLAINGGYFDPNFQTMGLLIRDGLQAQPISPATVLSGIVGINNAGEVALLLRDAELTSLHSALQAGPYIIDPGGVLGVKAHPIRAPRTILALNTQQDLIVVVTKHFSLHEVATCLLTQPALFGDHPIERALNLDGGPSTGMACVLPAWNWPERGPVRNVLVALPVGDTKK
jgi:hypothetical protein